MVLCENAMELLVKTAKKFTGKTLIGLPNASMLAHVNKYNLFYLASRPYSSCCDVLLCDVISTRKLIFHALGIIRHNAITIAAKQKKYSIENN